MSLPQKYPYPKNLGQYIFCHGPLMAWDKFYDFQDFDSFSQKFKKALSHLLFMIVSATKDVSFCAFLGDLKTRIRLYLKSEEGQDYKRKNHAKVHDFLVVLADLLRPCKEYTDYEGHTPTAEPLPETLRKFSYRLEACVNNPRVQTYYRDVCLSNPSKATHCTMERWMQLMGASPDLTEDQIAEWKEAEDAKLAAIKAKSAAMEAKSNATKERARKQMEEFKAKMKAAQELLDNMKAQHTKLEVGLADVTAQSALTGERTAMALEDWM